VIGKLPIYKHISWVNRYETFLEIFLKVATKGDIMKLSWKLNEVG